MQPTAIHVLVAAKSKLKTIGGLRGARVARLRKKIEPDPGDPRFILTAHGDGYGLCMNQDLVVN